jgi:hypothetical protein
VVHAGDLREGFLKSGAEAVVAHVIGASQVILGLVKNGRLEFEVLEGLNLIVLIEGLIGIVFPVLDNME